jgi:hypothetical protein
MLAPTGTNAQNRTEVNSAVRPRRYNPRSLSVHSKWRFNRRRRAEYFRQIVGTPTPWQIACVESLIRREWVTRLAEHGDDLDGTIRADREFQKLADAFRRSLTPPAAKPPSGNREAFLEAVAARSREAAA